MSQRGLRVLVLNQHYWPEIAATAQILSDLCEDLSAAGHEVTVLCGHPSYRKLASDGPTPSRETHLGVKVRRVWTYAPSERTIPKRLLHYFSYFASSLIEMMRVERPDVCLVMSTPPLLLGATGALLRTLRGVPFVYWVQDLYPDIAVHLGVLSDKGQATRLVERIASATYLASTRLVTLSPAMADRLRGKGVPGEKIDVISNWADADNVRPLDRDTEVTRMHGETSRLVVQYSGNLGLSQGLELVLDAAGQMRSERVLFALVGDGNAKASLERAAEVRGLSNVLFIPPQPRRDLCQLLSACDVGLVTMKRGVAGDLVPSKLYGIMAAGRPVLACVAPESEVARVVRSHDCGWVVEPESPDALTAQLKAILTLDPRELRRLGNNARMACERHYSRGAAAGKFERVLRDAAGKHPSLETAVRAHAEL